MQEIVSLRETAESVVSEATHLAERNRSALVKLIVVYVNCVYQLVSVSELARQLGVNRSHLHEIKSTALRYDLFNPVTRKLISTVIDRWATQRQREAVMIRVLSESELGLDAKTVQRIVELINPVL